MLKVVSGEKEGGTKVYSIDGYYCGTVALDIFFSPDSDPILHCKSGGSKIETYLTKIVFYTVEYDICICYLTI